jgi:hypothetical protein
MQGGWCSTEPRSTQSCSTVGTNSRQRKAGPHADAPEQEEVLNGPVDAFLNLGACKCTYQLSIQRERCGQQRFHSLIRGRIEEKSPRGGMRPRVVRHHLPPTHQIIEERSHGSARVQLHPPVYSICRSIVQCDALERSPRSSLDEGPQCRSRSAHTFAGKPDAVLDEFCARQLVERQAAA